MKVDISEVNTYITRPNEKGHSKMYKLDKLTNDTAYQFPLDTDDNFSLVNSNISVNARNIKSNLVKHLDYLFF